MHTTTDLHTALADLRRAYDADTRGSFGYPNQARARRELAALTIPHDVTAIDIRKVHEWNSIIGRAATDALVRTFFAMRHASGRPLDRLYQWGGDEFVIVTAAGTGAGLCARLQHQAAAITAAMPATVRATMHRQTGGLVDGLALSIAQVRGATDLFAAARLAVVIADRQKAGRVTGDRSRSGAHGTILTVREW